MADILDFFAAVHTPNLHARGAAATTLLLDALAPKNGQCVLEIGFGTGQTIVEIAARWSGARLWGVEKSPQMLAAAQRRLRFCGLQKPEFTLLSEGAPLPYPPHFFDAVFCESVLAIMPAESFGNTIAEIFRVLKPGGAFVFNESVWRDETPLETILEINRECQIRFGIPQSSEQFPYTQDWINLCVSKGFQTPEIVRLEKMPATLPALPPIRRPSVLFMSKLFSAIGVLKSRLSPSRRLQRRGSPKQDQHFIKYVFFVEGVLFKTRKPP